MLKSTSLIAVLALFTLSAGIADPSKNNFRPGDLVQPKVRDLLKSANEALNQGDINKTLAYADLVLIHQEIRYSIDTSKLEEAAQPEARQAAEAAIDSWRTSLKNEVKFTEVPRNQATVRLNFVNSVREMGREIAGHAVWQRQVQDWGNGKYSIRLAGDIKIRNTTPTGQLMKREAMIHTTAHEIGHLLGLWDSPNFGDIMGPLYLNHPVTSPSMRELNALKSARQEAVEIVDAAMLALSQS